MQTEVLTPPGDEVFVQPETYVEDIGDAYEQAQAEQAGYDVIAQAGFGAEQAAALGNSYYRTEVKGVAYEGNGREVLGQCPHMKGLVGTLLETVGEQGTQLTLEKMLAKNQITVEDHRMEVTGQAENLGGAL